MGMREGGFQNFNSLKLQKDDEAPFYFAVMLCIVNCKLHAVRAFRFLFMHVYPASDFLMILPKIECRTR